IKENSLRITGSVNKGGFIMNRYTLDGRLVSKVNTELLPNSALINRQRVSGMTIDVLKDKHGNTLRVNKVQTVR
ncbi:MAG: hypothetical protein Q4F84_10575, partial [Fibrobacter sp.]|nr:hypothetical protein [Fibrobacter sp.]